MTVEIYKRIYDLLDSGRSFAVATVISATSGTPRKSGTRMIVHPDGGTEFTIGGGPLEQETVKKSIASIERGEGGVFEIEFKENKSGMLCGGQAGIFIEVYGTPLRVMVFGGGHIGLALSKFFDILRISYVVADDRREYALPERFPGALATHIVKYDEPLRKITITDKTCAVIITHGHRGDKKILRALLGTNAMYIGMIGSKNKVQAVLGQLREEGLNAGDPRIHAPVGLDIGGETPEEIALSITAQIQKIRYEKEGVLKDAV